MLNLIPLYVAVGHPPHGDWTYMLYTRAGWIN